MQNQTHQNPFFDLITFVLIIAATAIIGNGLMFGITTLQGIDMQLLLQGLDENTTLVNRNLARLLLGLNNAFTFLLPAIIFAFFKNNKKWVNFLALDKNISILDAVFAIAIILCSIPFVQWIFAVNKALPLPEWARSVENDTEKMLKGLLQTEHSYETWLNIIVMAITPALGEEFVFRGVLQQKMYSIFKKNHHIAIWLSAAIFSAIHLQFEGFIPRMILGAVLGYLFYFSKSLWLAIFAHFINNLLQIVAFQMHKQGEIKMDIDTIEVPVYIGIGSLVVTVGLFFIWKKENINWINSK